MFDTHCHLNLEVFSDNIHIIIENARKENVNYFLVPGINLVSSKKAIEIADTYEKVYCAVGIHPQENNLDEFKLENLVIKLEELITSSDKVVAVGETGLDYYRMENNSIKTQQELFKEQARLAIKYNKSLIIHNRHATEDILRILKDLGPNNFSGGLVFHCCEAEDTLLNFALKYDYFIGVDGDVTYDETKQAFIKKVPLNKLVLETDSPLLIPEPLRQNKVKPNEPKYLKYILEKISVIKKLPLTHVSSVVLQNSRRLFGV